MVVYQVVNIEFVCCLHLPFGWALSHVREYVCGSHPSIHTNSVLWMHENELTKTKTIKLREKLTEKTTVRATPSNCQLLTDAVRPLATWLQFWWEGNLIIATCWHMAVIIMGLSTGRCSIVHLWIHITSDSIFFTCHTHATAWKTMGNKILNCWIYYKSEFATFRFFSLFCGILFLRDKCVAVSVIFFSFVCLNQFGR